MDAGIGYGVVSLNLARIHQPGNAVSAATATLVFKPSFFFFAVSLFYQLIVGFRNSADNQLLSHAFCQSRFFKKKVWHIAH
jgi:hypothetical protein